MASRKTYTRDELAGKSKIELKAIIREEGFDIAFTNSTLHSELMESILTAQTARAAAPPPRRQERVEPDPDTMEAQQVVDDDDGEDEEEDVEDDDEDDEEEVTASKVRVACGASSGMYPVVGATVGNIRKELKDILNIGKDHLPRVNGKSVADDFVLQEGDNLEFVRHSGDKAR